MSPCHAAFYVQNTYSPGLNSILKQLTELKQQDETNKCGSMERPRNLVDLALPFETVHDGSSSLD